MSRFLAPLRVEEIEDGSADGRGTWVLLSDLMYQSDLIGDVIIVPAGLKTDFASVPRIPIAYLLAAERGRKAAVVHDYLYQVHKAAGKPISRATADAAFREALLAQGEPAWRSWLMWLGVRVGGFAAWNAPHQPFGIA